MALAGSGAPRTPGLQEQQKYMLCYASYTECHHLQITKLFRTVFFNFEEDKENEKTDV